MVITDRDQRALILGGVGLALIGLYLVMGWHGGMVDEHEAGATRIARILEDESKAEYYAEQLTTWEEKVGPLSPPPPYSEQITAVGERIMEAANKNGVNLKESTPTASTIWPADPQLQKASFVIDAEAGWENVFKFVGALYQTEGVLSVEHLELAKKGDKLNVAMTVSILVEAPKAGERS